MKIIETDNFGGDYPDERFVNLPAMTPHQAEAMAAACNLTFNLDGTGPRIWRAVDDDYQLQPGFEP